MKVEGKMSKTDANNWFLNMCGVKSAGGSLEIEY